ncbi:class I SAM-dependent methyltransferase [Saccharopolyspora shandongensis]|uniref:class I SAM-dependent methyltransferase n=1 Tax=Saccharopolyspora shandongensis TaxID=418495 RepID=UPI00341859D3
MTLVGVERWGAVEALLLDVGCGHERLRTTIDRVGLEKAVDVAVAELVERCRPVPLSAPVRFQLEVTCGGQEAGRVLTLDTDGLSPKYGWVSANVPRIRIDAVDLLRGIFRADLPNAPAPVVTWSDAWADESLAYPNADEAAFARFQARTSAMQALLAAFTPGPANLGELSVAFGSDKWASFHWYTQHYQRHFAPLRGEPIRLLEIGIGGYQHSGCGGESLRMWQRYFPRAVVYGLDIFAKPHVRGPRIRAVQGDQNDPGFLDELGRELGPFDIVIDDGSHINEHVTTSLHALLPHVRPGGYYVIEDLQTSYWPGCGGDDADLTNASTSVGRLKELVDGLNHMEIPGRSNDGSSYSDRNVIGLHFYHNLAVVEKGMNAEDGIPAFIPRQYGGGEM